MPVDQILQVEMVDRAVVVVGEEILVDQEIEKPEPQHQHQLKDMMRPLQMVRLQHPVEVEVEVEQVELELYLLIHRQLAAQVVLEKLHLSQEHQQLVLVVEEVVETTLSVLVVQVAEEKVDIEVQIHHFQKWMQLFKLVVVAVAAADMAADPVVPVVPAS